MFRFFPVVFATGVAFAFAVLPVLAEQSVSGKKEFTTYCAPCHGTSGKGDGPVALELKKLPANLTNLAKKNGGVFDRGAVAKVIDGRLMPRSHGTAQMPVWGQFFSMQATAGGVLQEDRKGIEKQVKKRLENLVDFLSSIQQK